MFKYLGSTLFLFLLYFRCIFSQIPQGYYNSADGLSGEQLKSALHEIIKDHKEYPYTSSGTDVWDIIKETDQDPANPNNVILLYSGWSVNADQEYNSGKGWSREHVWAKSHGDFGSTKGAGTDLHHLRAADISINSARNNKDFDVGGEVYIDGDGTTECFSDADSWEPREEIKGDIARMLFYMAVRYEGENGEPDLELIDQVESIDLNKPGKGFHGKLSTLLRWHEQDPVDSIEIKRNNVIYSYQNNRNPFIDHPEYTSLIWLTTGIQYNAKVNVILYPNPAKSVLNIKLSNNYLTSIEIIDQFGSIVECINTQSYFRLNTSALSPGIYYVRIKQKDSIQVLKIIVCS